MTESEVLSRLDRAIRQALHGTTLPPIVAEVESQLGLNEVLQMSWTSVPLVVYGDLLSDVRSSWVFVLRSGITTGAERHPNSRQRMISYKGTGDLQTWEGGRWQPHPLDSEDLLTRRSISIPPNVWHRPVIPPGANWTVISFHTALADELLEERPEDDDNPDRGTSRSLLYAGRAHR